MSTNNQKKVRAICPIHWRPMCVSAMEICALNINIELKIEHWIWYLTLIILMFCNQIKVCGGRAQISKKSTVSQLRWNNTSVVLFIMVFLCVIYRIRNKMFFFSIGFWMLKLVIFLSFLCFFVNSFPKHWVNSLNSESCYFSADYFHMKNVL